MTLLINSDESGVLLAEVASSNTDERHLYNAILNSSCIDAISSKSDEHPLPVLDRILVTLEISCSIIMEGELKL